MLFINLKTGNLQYSWQYKFYDTKDKKTQIVQVIKRVTNLGDKYEGFQADIGSWDKYGDKDYSIDFDLNDLVKMYKWKHFT